MTPPTGVEAATRSLAAGRPVLLIDDVAGSAAGGSGALVVAAEHTDTTLMSLLVRESTGIVCVAMTGARLDELRIPPIATAGSSRPDGAAFAVSVDLRCGVSTGISARDRAATVRALADPATAAGDLARPGHVLPLRARDGGVLERPRPAEAAVDLCLAAGLAPAAALATAVDADGGVAGCGNLGALAEQHGLAVVRVSDVVAWRAERRPVHRGPSTTLPTVHGLFTAVGYGDADGGEHLALVRGEPAGPGPVLVRVHRECLTGDVMGSLRCGCASDLAAALAAIDRAERGVLVYLRRRALSGVGRVQAVRGCGTGDRYAAALAAKILLDIGVQSALVLADDPAESADLVAHGVIVAGHRPVRSPLATPAEVG
ncbi:3,4-dihydroxy-2-butanone-4-phosphate synthase [Pseudonocardia sp. CA-142604]|uniref:3,4-dihydroxy-2-butanone-4-phosphate synthase n=1 Tax=Pseudonocardia sp. CA-142604 TaxID=3240024 RepID=UPI003D8B11ED